MRTGIIYGLVCTCPSCDEDEVRYVGQTVNLEGRAASHRTPSGVSTTPRFKFVHAHGSNNIRLITLEEGVPPDDLDAREVHWIKTLGTYVLDSDRGLNATPGGDASEWSPKHFAHLRKSRRDLNTHARKLDWEKVREIRRLYDETDTPPREIARTFDLSEGTLYKVIRNDAWFDEEYKPSTRQKPWMHYNRGDRAYAAKFTWGQVREVRLRYCSGEPTVRIAAEFDVSQSTVSLIGRGVNWITPEYTPPSKDELKTARAKWLRRDTPYKEETVKPAYSPGKLTDEDRESIVRRLNCGERGHDLAIEYGVSKSAISYTKYKFGGRND